VIYIFNFLGFGEAREPEHVPRETARGREPETLPKHEVARISSHL